ncbi:MAG: hypothetical protein Sylvanvirus14_14 [Sylvanvirus sp.]|uniref:mRNA capping enzyme adenylation domain-containing protein n=1 Tax=Sylvanvirus sp. TaxID=2487774 RepID=A0A3G5ALQ8_9VIRU|nr:MAG: hypothetical protein Sylvanvirus14_14 [Sylvanvirus sp.]
MSIEAYQQGRTFVHSQRQTYSEDIIGEKVPFGRTNAIRLYPETQLHKEISKVWKSLWDIQTPAFQPAPFAPPQCVTLTRDRWTAIRDDPDMWYVAWKTNGERFALLVTSLHYSSERVCVMINRRMDMFLIQLACPLTYFDGTLLTGDLIDEYRFEVDDIAVLRGTLVSNYSKSSRLILSQTVIDTMRSQRIECSKGSIIEHVTEAFEICAKPWAPRSCLFSLIQRAQLTYLLKRKDWIDRFSSYFIHHHDFWRDCTLPDGLILQKDGAPLGQFTVETIAKAKPEDARTRDWLLGVHDLDQTIQFYGFVGKDLSADKLQTQADQHLYKFFKQVWWKLDKTQSIQNTLSPFSVVTPVQEALGFSVVQPQQTPGMNVNVIHLFHNAIYECAPDAGTGYWKPIKNRDQDKLYANHIKVLEAEELDFAQGVVSIEEILDASDTGTCPHDLEVDAPSHFSQLTWGQELTKWIPTTRTFLEGSAAHCFAPIPVPHKRLNILPYYTQTSSNELQEVFTRAFKARNDVKRVLPNHLHLNLTPPGLSSFPMMSKYERAAVIGEEATRLSQCGTALVPVGDSTSVLDLAERTLLLGTLPAVIERPLPNGRVIEISAKDLDVHHNVRNMVN